MFPKNFGPPDTCNLILMLTFYRCVPLFKAWSQMNANAWGNKTSRILGHSYFSVNHVGKEEREYEDAGEGVDLGEDILKR